MKYIYINLYRNNETLHIGLLELSESISIRKKVIEYWNMLTIHKGVGECKGLLDSNICNIASEKNRLVLIIDGSIENIVNTRRQLDNEIDIEVELWKEQ